MSISPEQGIEDDGTIEVYNPMPSGVMEVVILGEPVPHGVRNGERGGGPTSPRSCIVSACGCKIGD